jgi:hypothetical protein
MRFFTRSARPVRKNHTVTPSTNLSGGTVPNHVWHLTGRSSSGTGSFSNRRTSRPPRSMCDWPPSGAWLMKPPIPAYSAAWIDSGCLLGCGHEHETLMEAASCIPCAGGYVVGIEGGVMRSLSTEEEAEFQSVIRNHPSSKPAPYTSTEEETSSRVSVPGTRDP